MTSREHFNRDDPYQAGNAPASQPLILSADEFNRELVEHVRPPDWQNSTPRGTYNLVVIGAGAAGLVTAAGAAGLGAKVALIERHLLGGDCLNVGCVPSKALLRCARAYAAVRDAAPYGVDVPTGVAVNFSIAMERLRRLRAAISPNDSAARFRGMGVDVFFGQARFTSRTTVEVAGQSLQFRKAVIASGARAVAPPIPGLAEAGYLTNETVFELTALPQRLAVIGAGPIGCELAQAFARLGSAVCLFEAQHGVLPNEDSAAAEIVRGALVRDGVRIHCCARQLQVSTTSSGKQLSLDSHDQHVEIEVDQILVGAGRAPNVEGLDLEAAGVAWDKTGVLVNDRLQTTNRRIYAAGDICSRFKFTHAADATARIAIQNALFFGRARRSALTIPWCTYTDPEVAHVGWYERDAEEAGIRVMSFVQELRDVDRAILDGATEGFVKVLVRQGTDRIVGATIVGPHAGDMIAEITLAMVGRLGLAKVARTIHPYPTYAESIRKIGDAYNRTRLRPALRWLLEAWFRWQR